MTVPTEGQTTTASGADVDPLAAYMIAAGTLHDYVSDMIEGGRLTEVDAPDDYAALVQALVSAAAAESLAKPAVAALIARNAELEAKTTVQIGVGDGGGQLFVYGNYDSIKAAQAWILRADALAADNKALRADAERWRDVARRFDSAKTSASERVLEGLKYPDDQPWLDLAEIVDAARTPAKGEDSCDSAT